MNVYLGIGANLGNPLETFIKAYKLLSKLSFVSCLKSSHIYLTEAISPIPQPDYLNAVWSFGTETSPEQLFEEIQKIEKTLGKIPKPKENPRIIDIDILLFGDKTMNENNLQIPHPRWKERAFVLIPFSDLVSTVFIPNEGTVCISDLIKKNSSQNIRNVKKKYDRSILWTP